MTVQYATTDADRLSFAQRRADRLLHITLYLTMLSGVLVFIEPSPYEAFAGLLGVVSVAAGVTLERRLVPLLLFMLVWNLGGALSLIPVANSDRAAVYLIVSTYLSATAVLYAGLFSRDSVRRFATMQSAYILAAVLVSLLGIVGYFGIAGSNVFVLNGRAMGTFKDPNVFAPFLILPLLCLMLGILQNGVRMRYLVAGAIILLGLLLSFSRGAWGHFAASAILMIALLFLTSPSVRFRARIVAFVTIAVVVMMGALAVILSFSSVRDMYTERASLEQSYDLGHGGRFGKQAESLAMLLDRPNGVGPNQFSNYFTQDPHNVYLNGFYSYGWLGGCAYAVLSLLTLFVGFRAVFVAAPWQPFLIASYAAYAGLFAEGFIIDTDHWRHYFLLVGLVWGLAAASERSRTRQATAPGV